VIMAQDDFDLAAALRHVHPAGTRRRSGEVEPAHVLLPESMRAERSEPKEKTERRIPEQLPLRPRMPDWSTIGKRPPVQRLASLEVTSAERPPVSRRRHGCSICGSTTVLCKDDGSPYAHKCQHKVWCRTQDGHLKCQQCEAERVTRAEQTLLQGRAARRQFAANVRRADQVAPRVGYDLVEVVRPVSCPICQSFLQGQRAVRVWVWDPEERTWTANTVQCCSHPRPGVPMAEMPAKYFEVERASAGGPGGCQDAGDPDGDAVAVDRSSAPDSRPTGQPSSKGGRRPSPGSQRPAVHRPSVSSPLAAAGGGSRAKGRPRG